MNRIIVAIITIMMLCPLAQAKNRIVTENDSQGNKKRVIELLDTVIDGKSVTDTLSVTTYEDSSLRAAAPLWRELGLELACKQLRNHHRRHRHHLCLRYAVADHFHHLLLQLQETESPIPPCRTGIGKRTTTTRGLLPKHQKREGHPHQRHQQHLLRQRTVHLLLGHHRKIWSGLHRTADHVHRIRTAGYLLHHAGV